ncbi:MAG: MFS transporter [Thermoanaerobaculia bacterium]
MNSAVAQQADPAPTETSGWAYHGWKGVAALFVILFFTAGGGFYVFPVYIGAMRAELGWTMGQISLGAAVFAIVFGLTSAFVGAALERFGARRVMLLSVALAGAVNLGLAGVRSLWVFYVIQACAGVALAGSTIIPAQALITRWFDRARGRAMAITVLGVGFGGIVLPPLNEWTIRHFGWRGAWVWCFAWTVGIVMPVIAIALRERSAVPSQAREEGREPGHPAAALPAPPAAGLTRSEALRTTAFVFLVAVYLLQLIGQSIVNFHFVPFTVQQAHLSVRDASLFLSLMVAFSLLGKVGFGWLADRLNPARLMAFAGFLAAVGPLALVLATPRSAPPRSILVTVHAVAYGLALGGQIVLLPLVVARCFGPRDFGRIMGLIMSGFAAGILLGIPVAGWSFDRLGTYHPALVGCAVAFLCSALASAFVPVDGRGGVSLAADPAVPPAP